MLKEISQWFLDSNGYSYAQMAIILLLSCVLSGYIFIVYRYMTKGVFFSKNFSIAIGLIGVITTAIILAMQSSLAISLGMVGALSIVRFRTAIKDPLDLLYLFWAISEGIICGSNLLGLAVILCVIMSVALFALDKIPLRRAPYLLIVNSSDKEADTRVAEVLLRQTRDFKLKSRNITKQGIDMIFELRTADENALLRELEKVDSLENVSLMTHEGETRF